MQRKAKTKVNFQKEVRRIYELFGGIQTEAERLRRLNGEHVRKMRAGLDAIHAATDNLLVDLQNLNGQFINPNVPARWLKKP